VKVVILGSGTSTGVPRIGNDWGECDPNEPKNRRTRVSVMVESDEGRRVLIDTSTDLRQQFLTNGIDRIDAVLWTHDHADHCHGIDDLRALRFGRAAPIPGYANRDDVMRLKRRFSYVFAGQHGYKTIVDLEPLGRMRIIEGFAVGHCRMPHGPSHTTAYRLENDNGSVCYATDFSEITEEMVELFADTDVLVCDCLRREPHPTHAHLAMALELAERSHAKTTILTHLDKSMDYATLSAEVPHGVLVGYDGMEVHP
jgi:phosphoribosyl 1,2-cyclic phosphate phosphodiesterase